MDEHGKGEVCVFLRFHFFKNRNVKNLNYSYWLNKIFALLSPSICLSIPEFYLGYHIAWTSPWHGGFHIVVKIRFFGVLLGWAPGVGGLGFVSSPSPEGGGGVFFLVVPPLVYLCIVIRIIIYCGLSTRVWCEWKEVNHVAVLVSGKSFLPKNWKRR